MSKHYVLAIVDKEGDSYGIHFPDYPGCVSGGKTFDEAVSRGGGALAFHLQGMAEDGDEIHPPKPVEAALSAARDDISTGSMPALMEIEFPGRAVRVNISIEEGLLSRVDRAATLNGQSRSAFLADAARVRLRDAGI
jgi:predicted RNase H-like HicB family nuclease